MSKTSHGRIAFVWLACAVGLWALTSAAAEGPSFAKLRAVPFTEVKINDAFWAPRQQTNRLSSIPVNLAMLEKSGNIRNFELAAAGKREGYSGPVFMDSDLYKGIEAAAYSLSTHPDPALEKTLDGIIAKIAAAQQPDGYLNTHFTVVAPDKRWTNLRDWHELYCAGHLIEGAVAHYQATGKKSLLNVATQFADHIDSVFGPPPKRLGYPGHPELELALIKLWRATGEKRYFELARFMVENRGRRFFAEEHKTPLDKYDGAYWQDDVPIREHRNIKGHAVRACYLLSGVTDVLAETGDDGLIRMTQRVWRNTIERNTYLTGGIGPSAHNEGFTVDYDLPNVTAYQETCATIALAQWNHRLALLYGESKYADVVERALYNGVLSGVSQDGTRFFYVNPLASRGNHHRSGWFGCACCPPNVARTLSSLGGYAYATSDHALWVNLFIQGTANVTIKGQKIRLDVTTDYPWDGKVTLKTKVETKTPFELRLRIPGWSSGSTAAINGKIVKAPVIDRGYLVLSREWRTGDIVELNVPLPVERIAAHPAVKANTGLLALQRGPLVYALEACDHAAPLDQLFLPLNAPLKAERSPLLGGVTVITGTAAVAENSDWNRTLYQSVRAPRPVAIKAIPYYAWDNREPGAMQVWLPTTAPPPVAGGLEQQAKVSVSFKNSNSQPEGVNDGVEPKISGEQPAANCHWWPHQATDEWVQYTWTRPVTVSGSRAYWFDDTGRGACRLPASWQVLYRDGETWKPVIAKSDYPVRKDAWCSVTFEPVKTTALRLQVKLQPEWAAGIHEWKLIEPDDE